MACACAAKSVVRPPPSVEAIRAELGAVDVERVADVFFVATDGGPDAKRVCVATVERMSRFLWRDFFEKRPVEPLRMYCFADAPSYEAYCKKTYGRPAPTPYGFYMPDERTAMMDMSTGTGTLAHVLTYPLIDADFADAPEWFRVGLASLYEQSKQTVDRRMLGDKNWRWRGLREAIERGRAITIEALVTMSVSEFHEESRGVHYATARYVCMWLQEKGKLVECYQQLKTRVPSRDALESVSGMKLGDLDKTWREWVLGLK